MLKYIVENISKLKVATIESRSQMKAFEEIFRKFDHKCSSLENMISGRVTEAYNKKSMQKAVISILS